MDQDTSQASSRTVGHSSSRPTGSDPPTILDLSLLPPIYVSATHFTSDDLLELEDNLQRARANVTYDIHEAKLVLSKVEKKARIRLDLRSKGLFTIEKQPASHAEKITENNSDEATQGQMMDDSSTESDSDDQSVQTKPQSNLLEPTPPTTLVPTPDKVVEVVRVEWFHQCQSAGRILPWHEFITYAGRRTERAAAQPHKPQQIPAVTNSSSILSRARQDARANPASSSLGKRKFDRRDRATPLARLLLQTTSEHSHSNGGDVPSPPKWVQQGINYSCQRLAPRAGPNDDFIVLLKRIRTARKLIGDEIGVRAYSTSIAALAAYPYKLSVPREVLKLPGCEGKIASLFVEYANTGRLQAVDEADGDPEMKILKLFFDIWGVGASTAREFYRDKGWKDLDDVVDFGWRSLSKAQQIGVKFYDEFQDLIPRAEVEHVGRVVHSHAVKVRNSEIQSLLVGGYRRGKMACGDVDVILSHPDQSQTLNLVNDIVDSLEDEGWITHILTLSLNGTKRDQKNLPFRGGSHGGHSFDSLDKALVVWQDPTPPRDPVGSSTSPQTKNSNPHRRVDIIVSPWRSVGSAVLGWSGGTTFERDLRQYAKAVKGWKFDSSGVRSHDNGEVVDVEGFLNYTGSIGQGRAKSMEQAEKRVFEAFGLEYREPWERCTG